MRIYREKDYDAMSRRAAHVMAAEIIHRPDCVLGLATGSLTGTARTLTLRAGSGHGLHAHRHVQAAYRVEQGRGYHL